MAKTVKDAYGEILRLRNEFYQKSQEVPREANDENRDVYKAKYEAFDKALELLTPSIVDPQPEDSGELTLSVTKMSDQEEPVKPKFKVGDKIYKNVLVDPDEQWEVEKVDEEKGEYHIRNMFVVNGLCFEDQDDWELVEQKSNDNVETKFNVGQKFTDNKETDKWKLVEEPISEDLLDEIHNRWEDDPHTKWPKCPYKDFKNIACHFANWQRERDAKYKADNNICCMKFDDIEAARIGAYEQGKSNMKQQMMNTAIDGYIDQIEYPGSTLIQLSENPKDFNNGEDVKVIIIKE